MAKISISGAWDHGPDATKKALAELAKAKKALAELAKALAAAEKKGFIWPEEST